MDILPSVLHIIHFSGTKSRNTLQSGAVHEHIGEIVGKVTRFETLDLGRDLVNGLSKALDVSGGDASNGNSAVFGGVHRVL